MPHDEGRELAFDAVSDGVLILDGDNRIVLANAHAGELLNRSPAQLRGVDLLDAMPPDADEDQLRALQRALDGRNEHTLIYRDEFAAHWLEIRLVRRNGVRVVTLRNVTHVYQLAGTLRESERQAASLFKSNPNVMWLFDTDSRSVIDANRAALRWYGYSRNEFLALDASRLFAEGDEAGLARFATLPQSGRGSRGVAQLGMQVRQDGSQVLVELSANAIEWRNRSAVLVTLVDVAQRHLADEQLRAHAEELERQIEGQKEELAQARRELEQFVYALSHDLRAPLHSIDGFARALAQRPALANDERGAHFLQRIAHSSMQMARLVDDLLVLSRVHRTAMDVAQIDLSPVAEKFIAALRARDPQRDVAVEIEPGLRFQGNRELLSAALGHLLDNAWKFTSRKPQGWIRVSSQPGDEAGYHVLVVADNGAGFDTAHAGKLFTVFQRLHSSVEFPGAGVGLSIVSRIVARHGGKVWATTEPGQGATFFVSLPMLRSEAWDETGFQESVAGEAPPPIDGASANGD